MSGHVTDPGAGNYSFVLTFVNKGTSPCTLAGYPGVSAVGPTGAQIGRSATRTGQQTGPVTINSGQVASAVVRVAQAGDFDQTSCRPVAAAGFRVFPPGQTAALLVGTSFQACSGPLGQFQVNSMVAGIAKG